MDSRIIKVILCHFILVLQVTDCFIPSAFTPFITDQDYTHQDITEQGILLSVAEYFETKPAPNQASKPAAGSLTSIQNITARKLFDAYYGVDTMPDAKFQSAIDDIVNYNTRVEHDHQSEAAWHFNGEQISQGNILMQGIRDTTLDLLNVTEPNYQTARTLIGRFLHLLQDFYSNTNYNDISSTNIYTDLGISGKALKQIASPSTETCKNCGPDDVTATLKLPCVFPPGPLLINTVLTSGYRSGQDIVKPQANVTAGKGKCSHGGEYDTTASTIAAVGGINKETNTRNYSPLFNKHDQMAKLAIDHTKFFLNDQTYGIRKLFGNDKFEGLLQLHPGNSLAFVIDTSGSQEIDAVKQEINKIVTNGNAPYNYVLVYTSSGVSPVTKVTKNKSDIISWLSAISIPTNHSCSYSVTGLEAATTLVEYGSKVYVFTDAPPKDRVSINYIEALRTKNDLSITFLVTGQCQRRRRSVGKWNYLYRDRQSRDTSTTFTHQFLIRSGHNWMSVAKPKKGQEILLSVRVNNPPVIRKISKIVLKCRNDKQYEYTMKSLRRSKISGIYTTVFSVPSLINSVVVKGHLLNNKEFSETSRRNDRL